eukprot:TRINITY_DN25939_c0_g1_i1.p1 TRINITY_DN25939_c0_g1~~TRINITY_DN25939_c0_g1_i1.p1  ORF type:complete len:180 (+),score=25.99 TRINITY_DN25939_c0_g1_i1:39-542(+)
MNIAASAYMFKVVTTPYDPTKYHKKNVKPKENNLHWGEKVEYEITIHSGTITKSTDLNGLCDPWVVIRQKNENPEAKETLFKTPVQKKTLDPIWEVTQKVRIPKGTGFIFEVKDKDMIGSNKVGIAEFCPSASEESVTQKPIDIVASNQSVVGTLIVSVAKLAEFFG